MMIIGGSLIQSLVQLFLLSVVMGLGVAAGIALFLFAVLAILWTAYFFTAAVAKIWKALPSC